MRELIHVLCQSHIKMDATDLVETSPADEAEPPRTEPHLCPKTINRWTGRARLCCGLQVSPLLRAQQSSWALFWLPSLETTVVQFDLTPVNTTSVTLKEHTRRLSALASASPGRKPVSAYLSPLVYFIASSLLYRGRPVCACACARSGSAQLPRLCSLSGCRHWLRAKP